MELHKHSQNAVSKYNRKQLHLHFQKPQSSQSNWKTETHKSYFK